MLLISSSETVFASLAMNRDAIGGQREGFCVAVGDGGVRLRGTDC